MTSQYGVTKIVNGFVWPANDTECARVIFASIPDLERAIAFCPERRTVIQAGGNCGVWAKHLAYKFEKVLTWEPDALNFECLSANVKSSPNVIAFPAALGNVPGTGRLDREKGNCGAHQVNLAEADVGEFAIHVLDDLDTETLGFVDLIYLDVEGFELAALHGMTQTIERCRPVIAVEDKGLSERYGVPRGEVVRYVLETFGYEVCDTYARDVVMRPKL